MRVLAWGFLCVLALGVCSARAWGEAPKPRFGAKNEIPAHGGWILEWDATDLLRFPWPTEPGALSGNYYVYEDDGRGTPRFRDLSPVGWSVAAERALLLRKRKERFGAFVGVLGPEPQNLTWTRPAPEDPLEPFPAQVECRPTGAVRLWIAEAADPESLWAGWHRVLRDEWDRSRSSSGENAIPSGVWIGDSPVGESVALENKIGSRLRRLGFEGLLFSEQDLREKTALAVELGLTGGVRFDPLHVQEDELTRLPFDAVQRTPTQEGRFSVRSTLSGRRWTRSRLNALRKTTFVWGEEGGFGHPLSSLVATQRQKLRIPWVAATATPGESADFRFADEATLKDQLWTLAWRSPSVSNLHTAPSPIPTDPSRFRQWLYVRALAQGSFWVFDEDIRPELQSKISALLPRITPKVHAEDLFRTNTETDSYPKHFRVLGTHRDAHIFFNVTGDRESHIVRLPKTGTGDHLTGKTLIYDTNARKVRGVFDPMAELSLSVLPHEARLIMSVPDRSRPYVVGTGAHWSEGMAEIQSEIWDEAIRTLTVKLVRVPGATGVLAIAGPKPESVRVEGGEAGSAQHESRGAKPLTLVNVVWEEPEMTVRLVFPR